MLTVYSTFCILCTQRAFYYKLHSHSALSYAFKHFFKCHTHSHSDGCHYGFTILPKNTSASKVEEPGIAPQMIGGEPTLPLKPHPNRKPKAIRTLLNNTNFKIKLVGLTVKYWQRALQHFTFKLYSDQTVIYVLFKKNCC